VGRRIRSKEVRVIDDKGEQLGVLGIYEALDRAEDANLQLVEVNPKANPPVCKIMDYGRFKYETAKREREAKKHQKTLDLKEVKFRPKTHAHDFDFKVRHVRRFLEEGDKVKLVVQFRGREIVHPETGRSVLERVCKTVADIATVVQIASMEGNRLNMMLAPKAKKGGGGSARSEASASRGGGDQAAAAPRTRGDNAGGGDQAAAAPQATGSSASGDDPAAATSQAAGGDGG
jgi:translation initiation factor IF-3